jgi:hypothetical protein
MAHRYALGIRAAQLAAAAGSTASALAQSDATLDTQLDALEAQVVAAEDVAAIKRLQREYGYYVDKGMWRLARTHNAVQRVRQGRADGEPAR